MRPYSKSLKEYGRGIAGGLLFSLPMLYTMEVWWTGFTVHSESLIFLLIVTFLLLIGYNRFAGMRKDATYKEVMVDSVEELGLGLLMSFCILWMLDRISLTSMHHQEIIGKVVIEAMMVAIGISVGTAQLGGDNGEEDSGKDGEEGETGWQSQSVLSFCGAILVGANLAPTEEISMLAVEISEFQAILLVLFSLIITLLIMFYIDFTNTKPFDDHKRNFGKVIGGACFTYATALVTATTVLWFFGHFTNNSFLTGVKAIVVLGVAAGIGASAGRFLLKGNGK